MSGEDGFTLIALLLVMIITGIVVVPLSAAMFLGLRTNMSTQERLVQSNGAGITSSYFVPDVQNAYDVKKDVPESTACGSIPGSVKMLLTSPDGSTVSYFVDPAKPTILLRRTCANGAPLSAVTGVAVARRLSAAPQFDCTPVADCTGWQRVRLTLSQNALNNTTPYQTRVDATKKVK